MSINEMILNAKQNTIINATLGTATLFMTMSGLGWRDEVSTLCNTGGDLDEWKGRWKNMSDRAYDLMRAKLDAGERAKAAVDRVRALLDLWETEYGATATDKALTVEQADELEAALDGEERKG